MLPDLPLVAILRGLAPQDAEGVGTVLLEAGFRLLEVPLNRPGALDSIRIIAGLAPRDALVGGGTMLTFGDVASVAAAGGKLFVSPNTNPQVIRAARSEGMWCAPGFATMTEAFAALDAGAQSLKLFPAESPGVLKSMRAVLPSGLLVWPVGGIDHDNMAPWLAAGATGFGIGSSLYKPGMPLDELRGKAQAMVKGWQQAQGAAK